MRYTLERSRVDQYPTEKIIAELCRVAGLCGNRCFSRREFDEKAVYCKGTVVLYRFGTWQAALDAAGLKLEKVKMDRSQISNDQLFEELGRVWKLIGHRPSKDEWENADAKYSYTTYKARFGGWLNACSAFVENESCRNEGATPEPTAKPNKLHQPVNLSRIQSDKKRYVSDGLRYRVHKRDGFKCVSCGRSPATARIWFHIDHIRPFSRGGMTVLENLQTLCNECNWGKGAGA